MKFNGSMRGGSQHGSARSHLGSFTGNTHKVQGHNTDSSQATMRTRLLSETTHKANRPRLSSNGSCQSNKSVEFNTNPPLCNSHSYNESIRLGHLIKSCDSMPIAVCETNGQAMRIVDSKRYSDDITSIGTAV